MRVLVNLPIFLLCLPGLFPVNELGEGCLGYLCDSSQVMASDRTGKPQWISFKNLDIRQGNLTSGARGGDWAYLPLTYLLSWEKKIKALGLVGIPVEVGVWYKAIGERR